MPTIARYDGLAEWYDERLTAFARRGTELLVKLLGGDPGRVLEIGCGGGIHLPPMAAAGWSVVGLDVSGDQLRIAQRRAPVPRHLVLADAAHLPFPDGVFDAVAAAFIHTDVEDWRGVVREAARVLRPGGRLVYVGTHPCFVGPFSTYPDVEPPVLHPGYRQTERTTEGPGLGNGLRRRIGVCHVPLAALLNAFLETGLQLEHLDEPGPEEYPRLLAVVAHRRAGEEGRG